MTQNSGTGPLILGLVSLKFVLDLIGTLLGLGLVGFGTKGLGTGLYKSG